MSNKTHITRFKEEAWLQGSLLSCLSYGIVLTLFAVCIHYLFSKTRAARRSGAQSTSDTIYLLYTMVIFAVGTLFMGATAKYLDLAYIQNRNFPGGPSAFQNAMLSAPIARLGNVTFVMTNWISGALMIWRCSIIYAGCHCPMWMVLFVPGCLFGLSVALGTLWLVQASDMLFPHTNYILIYISVSLGLGVAIAAAITGRLFVIGRIAARTWGPGHASRFTSILALLIESSALYCVFCLVCLIALVSGSPVSRIFLPSLGHIQITATFLIIFRNTQGDGWTTSTATQIMSPMDSKEIKMVNLSANTEVNGSRELQNGVLVTHEISKGDVNASARASE
ncbi:hypothetical protein DFH09DRAFT_1170671 [Mycena vulgaris]|nr:hypothetical protein DFH09DRAFT_1170671 [Mycena vulgaris]